MPKKRSHGDGALYYLKERKLWRAVVDLGLDPETGKRRQKVVTSRSQKECRAKLERLKAEISEHGAPLDRTTTVADWAARWLEEHKKPHVKPKSYAGYRSAVARWILPVIGTKNVSAVRPSDISAIRSRVIAEGSSSTTALHAYRTVSMMLEDARREGLCARNVANDITPPRKAASSRDAIPIGQAVEILQVSASMEQGSRWWFKLLTGQRQGEILGAPLDDLHFDDGVYVVNWKLEEVPKEHGCGPIAVDGSWPCGKKQGAACSAWRWRIPDGFEMRHLFDRWCLTRPKSRTGRVVPLIPQLREGIRADLDARAHLPNTYGLVWRDDDGRPFQPKADATAFRQLLFEVGAITAEQNAPGKSPIDGHWARHTTITLLASLGVDAQVIGEIVGHSSEEVTRIYRHAHVAEKREAMEKLGGLMLAPAAPKAIGA